MQKQTRTDCVNGNALYSAALSVSERARDTKHAWEICCFPYKSRISFFSKPLMAWALLKKSPWKRKAKTGHGWVERVGRRWVPSTSAMFPFFVMALIEYVLKFHSLHPRVKLFVSFPYEKENQGERPDFKEVLSPERSPWRNKFFFNHLSMNSFNKNTHRKKIIVRLEEQGSYLLVELSTNITASQSEFKYQLWLLLWSMTLGD